jgi:hypothetical protein
VIQIGLVSRQSPVQRNRRCPSWVNRVGLTVGQPLPVYPDERTSSEPVGMSQTCQQATYRTRSILNKTARRRLPIQPDYRASRSHQCRLCLSTTGDEANARKAEEQHRSCRAFSRFLSPRTAQLAGRLEMQRTAATA